MRPSGEQNLLYEFANPLSFRYINSNVKFQYPLYFLVGKIGFSLRNTGKLVSLSLTQDNYSKCLHICYADLSVEFSYVKY